MRKCPSVSCGIMQQVKTSGLYEIILWP